MRIQIFTDGSAKGNPGPGGFGVILRSDKGHEKEVSQGFRLTTNNRMELLAVITGLEMLKGEKMDVTVFSDSKYVIDSVEKGWIYNWQRRNFANTKNADLWVRFLRIYPKHKVKFIWVKGHAGHPENERCDELAVAASGQPNLMIDEVYEREKDSGMFEE